MRAISTVQHRLPLLVTAVRAAQAELISQTTLPASPRDLRCVTSQLKFILMQPTQQLLVNVSTPEFRHSCPMQHQPPKRDRMEERQFELLALLEISVMQHPFPRENDWRRRRLKLFHEDHCSKNANTRLSPNHSRLAKDYLANRFPPSHTADATCSNVGYRLPVS